MADASMLDAIRAEHKALSEKRVLDKPLPGYSRLVGRFKAIDRDTILELTQRAGRDTDDPDAGRAFDADLLINTCEGIFERTDDDKLVPLNTLLEHWGDKPIVFDERLAEAVGAEIPAPPDRTTRSIVFAVLKVDVPDTGNDIRFGTFAQELWQWIRRGQQRVDADF